MSALYIVAAQPNPPGKDSARGTATDHMLNQEWLEFAALQDRNLAGDSLTNVTFNQWCQVTGADQLYRFASGQLAAGKHVRVHTGRGTDYWDGNVWHAYAGRHWFAWNNTCGDRATLSFNGSVIDSAFYRPNPPEGVLVRVEGTDELVPAHQLSYRR